MDGADPRKPPFIYVVGVAKNSAKELATFEVEGSQWMHAFRHNQALAKLPARIAIPKNHRFPDPSKTCPKNDTWVYVSGRLAKFWLDPQSGFLSHLDVDVGQNGTLAFMGRWTPPFTPIKAPAGMYTICIDTLNPVVY